MILGVYCVKDFRTGFLTPTFETNDGVAMRNFANACLVNGSLLNNFNEDFELWYLGKYDSEKGTFVLFEDGVELKKPICKASDFVHRKVDINEKL